MQKKLFLAPSSKDIGNIPTGDYQDMKRISMRDWVDQHITHHGLDQNDDRAKIPCIAQVLTGPGVLIFFCTCDFRYKRPGFLNALRRVWNFGVDI